MQERDKNQIPASLDEIGKTALYYEYISIDVKEDHAIEKTLTALWETPEVTDENIKKVTYYLVQRFFIKSANDKKENIDLISQIPEALKKVMDTLPPQKNEKQLLVKYFNLYLKHTTSTQEDLVNLFETYGIELKEFRHNLISKFNKTPNQGIHAKELIIEQIYQFLDSLNPGLAIYRQSSRDRSRKKIDQWVTRIFENHVIKGALDVVIALEEYCREEILQSRKRAEQLKKYAKLNAEKISREILDNPQITTIKEGWPVIGENIFIYIDNLSREHAEYERLLEELYSPIKDDFIYFFFSHFFMVSAYQRQTEKDIYLLEKTFRDLHMNRKFQRFFTSKIHEKIMENGEKAFYIENHFHKSLLEIKEPHKNAFIYLTLRYLFEETLDAISESPDPKRGNFARYKKAFIDFIRPKYPKFLDSVIFIYLKQSKDLERIVGNTKKSYSNIYEKNVSLLKDVFIKLGLQDDLQRTIIPCITGFEQSSQILKTGD